MQGKVGIITINRNGIDDTRECLDSLLHNSYENKVVILIDNNSASNEGERLRDEYASQGVHCILNKENRGFAGGCNDGIKEALLVGCEYVLLFNNDAVAKDGFLERIVSVAAAADSIGIVGPAITYYQSEILRFAGGNVGAWTGLFTHQGKKKQKSILAGLHPYATEYITGCCMLIKKEVITQIGLLDEEYFAYFEETDYCFKARKLGWQCIVVPDVYIEHKKSASAGNKGRNLLSTTQAFLLAKNGLLFGRKNYSGVQKKVYFFSRIIVISCIDILFHIRSWNVLKDYYRGLKAGLA